MIKKPKLLDLFCGAGGAAMGYHQAGFEVIGVDINPQPRFPFEFIQADALTYPLEGFDAIHASPPCQAYTSFSQQAKTTHRHPDMILDTRNKLINSGIFWVIENVMGAPLIDPIVLCGTMFPPLRVLRHRKFETSFPCKAPRCGVHPPVFFKYGQRRKDGLNEWDNFICMVGGYRGSSDAAKDAMGIDWMTHKELTQAIPPAYTEYIGKQLIGMLK